MKEMIQKNNIGQKLRGTNMQKKTRERPVQPAIVEQSI